MKRKLYSVEYVNKLKAIADKMAIYREMNAKTEDAFVVMFREFLASDEAIAEKFMDYVEDQEGLEPKMAINRLNDVAAELNQLLNR